MWDTTRFATQCFFWKRQTMLMVQNLDFLYIVKKRFGEEIFES
jgi:hypothetical protein